MKITHRLKGWLWCGRVAIAGILILAHLCLRCPCLSAHLSASCSSGQSPLHDLEGAVLIDLASLLGPYWPGHLLDHQQAHCRPPLGQLSTPSLVRTCISAKNTLSRGCGQGISSQEGTGCSRYHDQRISGAGEKMVSCSPCFLHLVGRGPHLSDFVLPELQVLQGTLLELCGRGLLVSSHPIVPCAQERKQALLWAH